MNKDKLINTLNKTTSQLQSRPKCKCWNSGGYIRRKLQECLQAGGSFSVTSDVSDCGKEQGRPKCYQGNCRFAVSCTADIPHMAPFVPGSCRDNKKEAGVISR